MLSQIRKRLGAWQFNSGQRVVQTIDRDGILYRLDIRARFTITNGGTGPVGPLAFALARLIQRLEVTINGKDTIINQPGELIASRALVENGALPYGMDATVVLTNSAVTVYDIVLPVDFHLPHSVRPKDTGLECRQLDQVSVAITFANADCSQLFTTPNSAAISAVNCEVYGLYEITDVPLPRDHLIRALDFIIQPNTGTNANLGVQMDRGPQLYRSFHIHAQRGNINVDTIVNNLKLQAGTYVYYDQAGVKSKADILQEFGLYAAPAANAPLTGIYRADFSYFGSLESAINVNPQVLLTDLFLYFDTTYTSGTEQLLISREAVRKLNIG